MLMLLVVLLGAGEEPAADPDIQALFETEAPEEKTAPGEEPPPAVEKPGPRKPEPPARPRPQNSRFGCLRKQAHLMNRGITQQSFGAAFLAPSFIADAMAVVMLGLVLAAQRDPGGQQSEFPAIGLAVSAGTGLVFGLLGGFLWRAGRDNVLEAGLMDCGC